MEAGIPRSLGPCMVMGTAATMMAIAEALGLALPGASSIPAVDSSHIRMCAAAGRRIVDMVWEDLTPGRILTPASFDNAIRVHMAMGGSTNAIIHLVAMARRARIARGMKRFDVISREVAVLRNVRPSGKYLMEDFYYAGGIRGLMAELRERLALACLTVTGKQLADGLDGGKVHRGALIHSLNDPISTAGATAVLTGNLAPRGCVMKPSAADPRLLKHRGPALAFEDYNHMAREIDRDDLDVTPDHVIVLKNAGPKGGPGMPEWGMLPIPKKLVKAGVRDMLRLSDARMSGTSYGACILHVAPESFVGGPLAFVRTGDEIEVDADARRIHLHVSDEELARRRAAWKPPAPHYPRGYGPMYAAHIGQAAEASKSSLGHGAAHPGARSRPRGLHEQRHESVRRAGACDRHRRRRPPRLRQGVRRAQQGRRRAGRYRHGFPDRLRRQGVPRGDHGHHGRSRQVPVGRSGGRSRSRIPAQGPLGHPRVP